MLLHKFRTVISLIFSSFLMRFHSVTCEKDIPPINYLKLFEPCRNHVQVHLSYRKKMRYGRRKLKRYFKKMRRFFFAFLSSHSIYLRFFSHNAHNAALQTFVKWNRWAAAHTNYCAIFGLKMCFVSKPMFCLYQQYLL